MTVRVWIADLCGSHDEGLGRADFVEKPPNAAAAPNEALPASLLGDGPGELSQVAI
jgi:hypothetical protein